MDFHTQPTQERRVVEGKLSCHSVHRNTYFKVLFLALFNLLPHTHTAQWTTRLISNHDATGVQWSFSKWVICKCVCKYKIWFVNRKCLNRYLLHPLVLNHTKLNSVWQNKQRAKQQHHGPCSMDNGNGKKEETNKNRQRKWIKMFS